MRKYGELHLSFSGGDDGFEQLMWQDIPYRFYFGHPLAEVPGNAQSAELSDRLKIAPIWGHREKLFCRK